MKSEGSVGSFWQNIVLTQFDILEGIKDVD